MTVCTMAVSPNWKSSRSPALAPVAAFTAARNSGVAAFARGDCVHVPSSARRARARPLAPMPLQNSSSLSTSARESVDVAGTTIAFTMRRGTSKRSSPAR